MIRSVFMLKVKPGATPEPLEALIRTSRTPMVEGCTISNGLDLGLRQGSFDFCQVTDIVDVEAYRRWDADPGHNRMRGAGRAHPGTRRAVPVRGPDVIPHHHHIGGSL